MLASIAGVFLGGAGRIGFERNPPMSAEASLPVKKDIIQGHRTHDTDTGSPEVQVALLTARVQHLTGHLKSHPKDNTSRRGLLMMVGKRAKLLRYLYTKSPERHDALVAKLGIRSTAEKHALGQG